MKEPTTGAEWQEAVDIAAGLRAIADCKMYGLMEGGPEIDVERCDQILRRGRAKGIRPSRSPKDLGIEIVNAINADARHAEAHV